MDRPHHSHRERRKERGPSKPKMGSTFEKQRREDWCIVLAGIKVHPPDIVCDPEMTLGDLMRLQRKCKEMINHVCRLVHGLTQRNIQVRRGQGGLWTYQKCEKVQTEFRLGHRKELLPFARKHLHIQSLIKHREMVFVPPPSAARRNVLDTS